ncbi:hypothetical protein HK097_006712, partial [Rhizophlyctis rosea]
LIFPDETFSSILATAGANTTIGSHGTPKRTTTSRTTQFADKELTLAKRLEADEIMGGGGGGSGVGVGAKQEVDYDWYDKSGRSWDGASSFMRSLSRKSLGRASSMRSWASKHRKNYKFFGKSKVTFLILNAMFTFTATSLLLFSLFTFLNTYIYAPIIKTILPTVLYLSISLAILMTLTGFIGFLGAFLHWKAVLVVFQVLVVPCLVGDIVIGYLAHQYVHDVHFQTRGTREWTERYGNGTRGDIQNV